MAPRSLIPGLVFVIAIVLLLGACGKQYHLKYESLTVESKWPYHRGSAKSTGAIVEGSFDGSLDLIWEHRNSDKPAGPMSINNGQLALPGTSRKIRFYDISNGDYLGRIKVKGIAQTGLTVVGGQGFYCLAPPKSRLESIDMGSGKRLWRRKLRDAAGGTIIVGDRLILSSREGIVSAFNREKGELIWSFDCNGRLTAPPSFGQGMLFQPTDDGTLFALSPEDGHQIYSVLLEGPLISAVAVNESVIATDMNGNVYRLDPADGSLIWSVNLAAPIWSGPTITNDRILIGHSGGVLVALDAANGNIAWEFDTGEVVRGAAAVAGNFVVVGTMGGNLYSLNAQTGDLKQQRQLEGALAQGVVTDGERIVVATEKGFIFCFGNKDASVSNTANQ